MNDKKTAILNPFGGLITSKTRVQILMRLFLNPLRRAYLRELADEFGASPSQVKEELAQLSAAGLLKSEKSGRQVLYRANTAHALYPELNSMVRKALGMDRIVESVIERLGQLEQAWLIDDYAQGRDSGIIDLLLVGDIDQVNLTDVITKTERHLGRRIRTLVLGSDEQALLAKTLADRPNLLLWSGEPRP